MPTDPATPKLAELERVARRLARMETTRASLIASRDQLIRDVLADREAGATLVARAAQMSTAAVYKIRDKEPA